MNLLTGPTAIFLGSKTSWPTTLYHVSLTIYLSHMAFDTNREHSVPRNPPLCRKKCFFPHKDWILNSIDDNFRLKQWFWRLKLKQILHIFFQTSYDNYRLKNSTSLEYGTYISIPFPLIWYMVVIILICCRFEDRTYDTSSFKRFARIERDNVLKSVNQTYYDLLLHWVRQSK